MQLWLIPLLPLLGFALNGLFGRRLPKSAINAIACGSVLLSFLWVVKTLNALGVFGGGNALEQAYVEHYFTWIQSGALNIGADFAVDRLTSVMLMIVTGVGLLIHIYSVGYMSHEGGYYRFFAFLNLFMFFMLVLVLGANFLLLFIGWEGVGLCSYLLISFYFLEKFATNAGNKAFIVNRIGDFGFSLAVFLIVIHFGSLDFNTVFAKVRTMPVETSAGWMTAISLLLLVGATGKSAQIPLYVWLPDAMAGPTPVSALIHAATMVTAGVYMIARSSQLFLHAHDALYVVAIVGLATAFFSATIGLAQTDIKKVYAYSTVSQLGYMFLGLGAGAFSAGIFHVMTHAFFKALLFLGAGSVIHALGGEQDLRKMGGLRKYTPITMWTLLAASLAISGFPYFSGFYSKDKILEAAYEYAPWMYWVGVFTAGMTAFYVFRAFFLTFFGEYRGKQESHDAHGQAGHGGHDDHGHGHGEPHESPAVMWIPLAILGVLSVVGGFLFNIPKFLDPMFPLAEGEAAAWLTWVSVGFGLGGIALAYVMYVASPGLADSLAASFSGLYRWIYNKYYVDEFYDSLVVEPTVDGSRSLLWRVADVRGVDGLVNGIGKTARGIGAVLKLPQSGYIRSYAAWVVLGSILVIAVVSMMGGVR
jgi:NADH-quinone oxidoreductase subunit L